MRQGLVYHSDEHTLDKLFALHQSGVVFLCPVCHQPLWWLFEPALARQHNLRPGLYCRANAAHLTQHYAPALLELLPVAELYLSNQGWPPDVMVHLRLTAPAPASTESEELELVELSNHNYILTRRIHNAAGRLVADEGEIYSSLAALREDLARGVASERLAGQLEEELLARLPLS